MTSGSKIVKITAQTALKGNMLKSILTVCVFLFCYFICNYSAGIFSYTGNYVVSYILFTLICIFLIAPLFLGLLRFIWRMLFSASDNPVSVFYYFSDKKKYLKALEFIFNCIFKAIPVALLIFLPTIIIWIVTRGFFYEIFDVAIPVWTANLNSVLKILIVFAIVSLVFYMLRFYIAPILFVADEKMDVSETLHMSTVISRKSSLDFIYLISSFIGWILISVLVIPLIFTLPYILTSYAVHVRFAIAEYNKHIGNLNNNRGVLYE